MNQTYNPRRHGRTSETDPEDNNVREEWEHCHVLNAEHGGDGYSWVPTGSIFLRDDLQPRIEAGLDTETARRYADAFDLLPPVLVQRGSLHLIDGRHRIRAAYLANPQRYYIKAVEIDVPDEDMIDHAVKANAGHGRVHTQKERLYWGKDFLRRHPDWSDARIAEWTGASRKYVWEQRAKDEAAAATKARVGRDGRTRDVSLIGGNQLVTELQVEDQSESGAPTASEPSQPLAYLGTHFPGGKPAGFFAPGSQMVDLSTGEVVRLVAKVGDWATVEYGDGESYKAHLTKDLRFAPVVAATTATKPVPAQPAPPRAPTGGVPYEDVRTAIEALAAAIEGVDADDARSSFDEATLLYYVIIAEPVVEWLAAFVDEDR